MELTDYKVGDKIQVLFDIHKIDGSITQEWRNAVVKPLPRGAYDAGLAFECRVSTSVIYDKNRVRMMYE